MFSSSQLNRTHMYLMPLSNEFPGDLLLMLPIIISRLSSCKVCYSVFPSFWLNSSIIKKTFQICQSQLHRHTEESNCVKVSHVTLEDWETYVSTNKIQSDLSNPSILHLLNDNVFSLLRNGECDQCLCGVWHPVPGLHQQHGSDRSQHQRRPLHQVKLKNIILYLLVSELKGPSVFLTERTWLHFTLPF